MDTPYHLLFQEKKKEESLVGTISIANLFKIEDLKIKIPPYQRPYVWSEENISQLWEDWIAHFFENEKFNTDSPEYYLGLVMLYENKDGEYEIIDGQQRLTTLLIMDYLWNNSDRVDSTWNFNYSSQISLQKIIKNKLFIQKGNTDKDFIKNEWIRVLKKLVISVIITTSQDDSFTFFSTQNNRGVTLDEVDFFKSYHLREVEPEEQMKHFATDFDRMNSMSKNNTSILNNLNDVFKKVLWKNRYWSKNHLYFPNRNLLLKTFQKSTFIHPNKNEVKLFPSNNNILGTKIIYDEALKPRIQSDIQLFYHDEMELPFAMNQPIQRGAGFFLYTKKYWALFKYIFIDKKVSEIACMFKLIQQIHNNHFINLYQITILLYYDKFKLERIDAFSKYMEHYLGAFRMNRSSIVPQSPIVLLRDFGNILMTIQHEYLADDVINSLRKFVPETFYQGFAYQNEEEIHKIGFENEDKFSPLTRARQNYFNKVVTYYEKVIKGEVNLENKKNWIYESLN